jgi:thymidylate synthase (FAD)
MAESIVDPRFRVDVIAATPHPQLCVYAAMHQDYSEGYVAADRRSWPDETRAGEICVKRLLAGERGHYGPLEHAQIVLNVGWFPHSVMQQARTHRVGVSFDVQCLAGDTAITVVQASGATASLKIAKLHQLWTHGDRSSRQRQRRGSRKEPWAVRRRWRQRLRTLGLRVLNEATGVLETSSIAAVLCSGVQPVYRLTMEDGRWLDCTVNHRLLTPEGWQTMGEALALATRGDGAVCGFRRSARLLASASPTTLHHPSRPMGGPISPISLAPAPHSRGNIHTLAVANVAFLGTRMTYDLEVRGPWHNFLANGLVVHNSMRYTGERICKTANGEVELKEVFYLRPAGNYSDRQGKKYAYSASQRAIDLALCQAAAERYRDLLAAGFAEEHARGILPFDYRQHFVVSFSLRAFLHFLDLRAKLDAQQEIRTLCDLMWPHLQDWAPQFAEWYQQSRLHKARLAP